MYIYKLSQIKEMHSKKNKYKKYYNIFLSFIIRLLSMGYIENWRK